jgi:hypothetical protein
LARVWPSTRAGFRSPLEERHTDIPRQTWHHFTPARGVFANCMRAVVIIFSPLNWSSPSFAGFRLAD